MRVIFALGFRPFFLLAGWLAILLMAFWVPVFVGGVPFDTYYGQIGWHSHEMIFGYTIAVIAGFLLTAVRNWTNTPTPSGLPLAGMGALWLVARILPILVAIFPRWLIAAADLAFLPTFAIGIAVPLLQNNEKRNLIFLPLLAVLWSADLLVHADLLGLAPNLARKGVFLGLDVIILVIVIMGGRVIPFFTERALSVVLKRWRIVEWLSPLSVVLFLLAELFVPDSVMSASLAALAACCQWGSVSRVVHAAVLACTPALGFTSRLWLDHPRILLESRHSPRPCSATIYHSCVYRRRDRCFDARDDGSGLPRPYGKTAEGRSRHDHRLCFD